MNIPPVIVTQTCGHCGALSQTRNGKCWLCYESETTPNPYAISGNTATESGIPPPTTAWDIVFSVLLGICVLLTLLIAIGLAVQDPGTLIPFAILMGPAYLVTIIRGAIPSRSTKGSRPASLFLTFIVSLLATVLISTVLIVAAAVLFFLACIGIMGSMGK
jgi:hypothetical protein